MWKRDLHEKLRARANRLERGALRMRRWFLADTRELRWLQTLVLAGPQVTNRAVQALVGVIGFVELGVILTIDLPAPLETMLVLAFLWLVVRLCIPAGIAVDEAKARALRAQCDISAL
jgi:hypothetical protein